MTMKKNLSIYFETRKLKYDMLNILATIMYKLKCIYTQRQQIA